MKKKLKLCWWIIKGRPLMFKIHFTKPVFLASGSKNTLILDCIMTPDKDNPAFTLESND